MNRSFWITLAVSVVFSAIALVGLRRQNESLSQRLAEVTSDLEFSSENEVVSETEVVEGAATNAAELEQKSAESIRRARTAVASYVAGTKRPASEEITVVVPGKPDTKIYWPKDDDPKDVKGLSELLRAVENLSLDELIATIENMPPEEGPDSGAKHFLMALAVEQDPRAVYRNKRFLDGLSVVSQLSILAEFDPAAALADIPPLDSDGGQDQMTAKERGAWLDLQAKFATKLMSIDVDQGLQALLEVKKHGRSPGSFPSALAAEQCIPDLIDAASAPEYADLRGDLVRMTLDHSLIHRDMETVAGRAQAMNLSEGELNAYFDTLMKTDIMAARPLETINWMTEVRSARLPSAFVDWANQDLVAATDWLSDQDSSPERDKTIARFASESSELDNAAARAWAEEIEDASLRERTLRKLAGK